MEASIQILLEKNINPSIIRYAIAASSSDTSNLVSRELKVGRDRLVPEFNYLEPRAAGKWDMLDQDATENAVAAMDYREGGAQGREGRPPPNEDGTPNETLADVGTRLRQLLSVMETQYSGDSVLVVACDSTTLALLSCMMAGIPFNEVHELDFRPGEVRVNVTPDSIRALLNERRGQPDSKQAYSKRLQAGEVELARLRGMDDIVSRKDELLEEEQREIDEAYQRQEEEKSRKLEETAALQRERQAEVERQQKEKQAAMMRRKKEIEEERSSRLRQTQRDKEELAKSDIATDDFSLDTWAIGGVSALLAATGLSTFAPIEQGTNTTNLQERESEGAVEIGREPLPAKYEDSPAMPATRGTSRSDMMPSGVSKDLFANGNQSVLENYPTTQRVTESLNDTNAQTDGDRVAVIEASKPLTKEELAENAMEDYLNQDDGGEDWLKSIYDIIDEEDDSDNTEA